MKVWFPCYSSQLTGFPANHHVLTIYLDALFIFHCSNTSLPWLWLETHPTRDLLSLLRLFLKTLRISPTWGQSIGFLHKVDDHFDCRPYPQVSLIVNNFNNNSAIHSLQFMVFIGFNLKLSKGYWKTKQNLYDNIVLQ